MDFRKRTDNTPVLAVAVGVSIDGADISASLEELARLIDTAGCVCFAALTQTRTAPDARTCIGKGKLSELAGICRDNGISLVVFDCELSPSQIKNIENELDGPEVIDRSMLILDIFALHASTREGKLQVELAQLQYTAPRLMGKGTEMSRLEGRMFTRGPGESKLETDRRHIHRRMDALRRELEEVERNRGVVRTSRERSGITHGVIVGYTNAGKSTLMNALCNAGILAEDKLFATLDPTTRRYTLPDGREILLTDTVGFIRNLPHQLISAFRSTLDEVRYADFLIVVSDASDPEVVAQTEVTEKLLSDLCPEPKPRLYVFNKADLLSDTVIFPADNREQGTYYVFASAKCGTGLDVLSGKLIDVCNAGRRNVKLYFPHSAMSELNRLYRLAAVKESWSDDGGTFVVLTADRKTEGQFARYIVNGNG